MTLRARMLGRFVAFAAVLTVGAACTSSSTAPSPTSSGPSSTSTTAVAGGTAGTTTTTACAFSGGEDEQQTDARGTPQIISSLHHEVIMPGCVEAVVFSFERGEQGAQLGYDIRYQQPPFQDASGRSVSVEGQAFLEVTFANGTTVDLSGAQPRVTVDHAPEPAAGAHFVVDLRKISDHEGVSDWVIGLDARHPFTVDAQPRRVTIRLGAG